MNEKLENMAIEKVAEILKGDTFYYQDVECCVISDAEECYIQGYKDAVQKACEWLKNKLPPSMFRSDFYMFNGEFIEDFKKAMKGGEE